MWTERPAHCAAADELLARGAWTEARSAFEAVLRDHETPDALEGLALAAWWLDAADVIFDARERAYRLYTERGAARVAVWLAWDAWAFRGEHAVSNGWLPRASAEGSSSLARSGHFEHPAKMTRPCDVSGGPGRVQSHVSGGPLVAAQGGNMTTIASVLSVDPTKPVPCAVRLKFPAHDAIPAHSHPTERDESRRKGNPS